MTTTPTPDPQDQQIDTDALPAEGEHTEEPATAEDEALADGSGDTDA